MRSDVTSHIYITESEQPTLATRVVAPVQSGIIDVAGQKDWVSFLFTTSHVIGAAPRNAVYVEILLLIQISIKEFSLKEKTQNMQHRVLPNRHRVEC